MHAPILPRLALLAAFAIALGALRPALPRALYLIALRVPRWGLAAMWVEAVVGLARGEFAHHLRRAGTDLFHPPPSDGDVEHREAPRKMKRLPSRDTAQGSSTPEITPDEIAGEETQPEHARILAHRTPLASAFVLAGAHVVDLIAGAWLGAPWEAPAWGYARAATWAAYAGVACVMGWAGRKG